MVTLPTVTFELAFSLGASTSTYLSLDDMARGKLGTGTLAADTVFTDTSAYISAFSTRRGASRVDSPILRFEAGTLTAVLDNSDRRFDPTNLVGPYVSGGVTQVTPMRAARLRATWAGITYDLFRGYADAWRIDYDDPSVSTATLTCTDGFKVLATYDRIASGTVGAGEDSGARVNRILDSVGWSVTDRVIATGNTTLQATTLADNTLTELFLTADSELGELYIDGAGRVVFRNRHAVLEDVRSTTSQGVFGDGVGELPYQELVPDYDDTQLANLVQVGRAGGTQQVAQDGTSRSVYLTHTFNRTDLLMQTDTEAAQYAAFVLYQGKDPELRFSTMVLNSADDPTNLLPHMLGREVGDRITINRRPPGGGATISRDVFIRGIEHQGNPRTWITTWSLQSATKYAFLTLNNSTLGVLDSNALAF